MTGTGILINAPAPTEVFYNIIGKIPNMFDRVYTALNYPIVWWMILILVICLFIFSLR